jgi:CelD/BcsL family acetyltransferase involved in cellulose biosynthesis
MAGTVLTTGVLPENERSAVPASISSVEVVTDEHAFNALAGDWNDAVERAAVPYPFLRHEWVRTWWECFHAGARLHVLIVRRNGRIAAIAPLLLETTLMYGVRVRRLRFLQNDHTPRCDFIVADAPDESYRALWSALAQTSSAWDVIQLSQLPRGSMTLDILPGLACADGCTSGVWRSGDAPYLVLRSTLPEFMQSLSAKFRQNLRNRQARLARIGEPALEDLRLGPEMVGALDDAFRLEASGWKKEEGTSIQSDPSIDRFYRLLAQRGGEQGWMRLLFLTVNGRRIATSYGATFGRRLFLFKTGYDPEYAQCSPFKLLSLHAIERSYAEGLVEVDFLGDSEPWKLEWTTTVRGHEWLFIFANRVRGRLLHRAKFQLSPALSRWRH